VGEFFKTSLLHHWKEIKRQIDYKFRTILADVSLTEISINYIIVNTRPCIIITIIFIIFIVVIRPIIYTS